MLKTRKRWISLLVTLAMLVAFVVPFAGPASAQSVNAVDRVLSVSDTYEGTAATLTIKENSDFTTDFSDGQTFRLTLPSGVKWSAANITYSGPINAPVVRSDQVLEVTMNGTSAGQDIIRIGLGIKVDGATGDIAVTVDPMDSAVTGGSYVFARVGTGKTTAVCEKVETIGQTGTGGTIRIDETSVGAVGDDPQDLVLKLPSNFSWNNMTATDVVFAGGFAGITGTVYGNGSRTLTVTFDPPNPRSQRGTIYVFPKIKASNSASYGDVSVSVSGDNISDADLVIAKYASWGVTIKVKEVKELLAGKFDDIKTEKITIEENVPGSLISGRNITFTLPEWVKITDVTDFVYSGGGLVASAPTVGSNSDIDGTGSEFDIPITHVSSGNTGKIEFKLCLSIEGNKTGDITATVSGAGIDKSELVIAKAVAPVTASAQVADVKIGVQSQSVPDVIITESVKGALEASSESPTASGILTLSTPAGVKFASTPKVEVTSGDLEIKSAEVRLSDYDTVLNIPIKSESLKPGTIKVSGIKLTLDRTVPEGDLLLDVGGNAAVENSRSGSGWLDGNGNLSGAGPLTLDAGEFETGTVTSVKVANCVTPAPGEQKGVAVFKIGEAKYTVNGQEVTMDVAPIAEAGRTYLPARFVANAMGVSDSNIIWDQANQTVTVIRNERIVQMKVGSNQILVNGIALTMDVAPKVVPGRVLIPFRFLAQALGAEVVWDAADPNTITLNF